MNSGYLVSLTPGFQYSEYAVKNEITLGRDPDNADIILTEPTISRQHFKILVHSGGESKQQIELIDLASINGVYVNHQKVSRVFLTPGDFIGIGKPQPHLVFQQHSASQFDYELKLENNKGLFTIGRDSECDVSFSNDPRVSSRHAQIIVKPGSILIKDTDSLNGTWVNGIRVSGNKKLELADVVLVGSFQIKLILKDEKLQVICSNQKQDVQIETIGLRKSFKTGSLTKDILKNINLSITGGEFIGILGPSGAGKTNLLKTLAGQQPPTEGCVLYNEIPLYRHQLLFRNSTAYVPQDDIIHNELSVKQCLDYIARLRLPSDINHTESENLIQNNLAVLRLEHVKNNLISELSGGQRKRVSIATELITRPSLLFLDEPTSGLDPSTEEKLMHLFKDMTSKGSTVLITTHILYNLALLDKVIIMARGKLVFFGEPNEALGFFSETDKLLNSAVTIFDHLEGETEHSKKLIEDSSQLSAQEQLAEIYAQKFNSSVYSSNHISNKYSGFAKSLKHVDLEEGKTSAAKKLLEKPVASKNNRPAMFSLGRCLAMCSRVFAIKTSRKLKLGLYFLAPLIFGLIVLSLGTQKILTEQQVMDGKQNLDQIINGQQFSIADQIKLLFSGEGLEDKKAATDIVYSMLNEGISFLPIPMSALIMFVMSALFMGTLISCLEISTERSIFHREYMTSIGVLEYLVSKLPFLMLVSFAQVLFMMIVCLMNPDYLNMDLIRVLITLTLISWVAVAMGLFVSAVDTSRGQFSVVIALIIVLPQLILSGALGPDFYLNMNNVSKNIAALLPAKWGLEMLVTCAHDVEKYTSLQWLPDYTRNTIGFQYGLENYLKSCAVLIGQLIFWLVASYAVLKRSVKLK